MIPVFEPAIGQEEIDAVVSAIQRGEISGSFGNSIPEFEEKFARYCGCKYGIAVSNGSTALHMAVTALGIGQGNEILVSASTNIATALAAYHNGAVAVSVDSEDQTWNLDLDLIESLCTERTRAIIPVHLYGHPVDMDRLVQIARKLDLKIIEDCAEAHGAQVRGKRVGAFGDLSCFSFYANKIITTGEGGMVLTDDEELAGRLRLLRNLGFTKPRFRHEVAAFNFRMTGYQAAMGLAQLSKIDTVLEDKRRIAKTYQSYLSEIPGLRLPREEDWAYHVYWMYAIEVTPEFPLSRDQLMGQLQENGIETRTFFCPMNMQPCLEKQAGYRAVSAPVAERLWRQGLYLPSSPNLSEENIQFIVKRISEASLCEAPVRL